MNHLISMFDFSAEDMERVFELAKKMKKDPSAYTDCFKGKSLGLIFQKPSTRTRVSFEVGFATLGGYPIYLGAEDMKLGIREDLRDIARTLSRYLDAAVLRTLSHETIVVFSRYFDHPVINGLSDIEHPCQALSDFFTMSEIFGSLKKIKVSYIGDGNNVCQSLLLGAARLGISFSYATPSEDKPLKEILRLAGEEAKKTNASIEGFTDPKEAVRDADVIYTDVWVSMGQEAHGVEKKKRFQGFQVNDALLQHAKKSVKVMHCLPAHRGEELTDEILDGKSSIVFDQAENRMHVQRAILIRLLGKN